MFDILYNIIWPIWKCKAEHHSQFINQTNHKETVWYHQHSVGVTRTSPLPCIHVVSISLFHCPWFETLCNDIYFDNWRIRCWKVQLDWKCGHNLVCWESLTWWCRSVAKCLHFLSTLSWIWVSFLNTCFLLSMFPSQVCVYSSMFSCMP